MKRSFSHAMLAGLFILCGTTLALAEEMQNTAMNDEQKAVMARMQDYATPNANHEILKALAGSWNAHVQFWMDTSGKAQESDGTATASMIMDGRFLEQIYKGTMAGKTFEGRALWGYDNLRKEYTSLWFDNMTTGIMISTAQYDAAAKTLTEIGSMSCPITNDTHRWYKAVTTFIDADKYTYESYMKDKDGKEFKGMLITYTRAK